MKHPWHELGSGKKAPEEVEAYIEVSKNSMLKYELDKDSGHLKLDRVLYSAVHYPGDYGFIPQTLSEDGDPLDIIIISNFPVTPGVIVKARPIGIIEMIDEDERDEKIIAVHAGDARFNRCKDLKDVSEQLLMEIKHFFGTYKELQHKKVKIQSMKGASEAKKVILKSIEAYKKKFKSKS